MFLRIRLTQLEKNPGQINLQKYCCQYTTGVEITCDLKKLSTLGSLVTNLQNDLQKYQNILQSEQAQMCKHGNFAFRNRVALLHCCSKNLHCLVKQVRTHYVQKQVKRNGYCVYSGYTVTLLCSIVEKLRNTTYKLDCSIKNANYPKNVHFDNWGFLKLSQLFLNNQRAEVVLKRKEPVLDASAHFRNKN